MSYGKMNLFGVIPSMSSSLRNLVSAKFSRRLGVVLSILFISNVTVMAATSRISGSIKDSQTGQALPGGIVVLKGTSLGASTDLNGNYVISSVPTGTYTIKASYVGYLPEQKKITVKAGENLTENFKLKAVGVKGKTVVVTAQASGQNGAINQQLSSDRIVNVVSAAKIQQLPDANAAESVGRLPGVSLVRQGGEGSQIVIRGLAPQYNQVEIDGVQMPGNVTPSSPTSVTGSSNFGDRAVNLSMISSNMLGGITLTKSITPDMDAAVLGGVVNFKLREARSRNLHLHLLAQGGYDGLQNRYDDYKYVADAEKRFFNGRFGVFAEADAEQINLTSNILGASYFLNQKVLGKKNPTYIGSLSLTDVPRIRNRYDATVTMDYRIPNGKIDFMNFGSTGITNEQDRGQTYSLTGNSLTYSLSLSNNVLSEFTDLLEVKKQISSFNVDLKLSHVYSQTRVNPSPSFSFVQNHVGISNPSYEGANPQLIPTVATPIPDQTFIFGLSKSNSLTRERDMTGNLDISTNINFSNEVTSTFKFGGEYRYTIRSYAFNEGNGNVYYSGSGVVSAVESAIEKSNPSMDSIITKYGLVLPVFEDHNYHYGTFLGGDYTLGPALNAGMLEKALAIAQQTGTLEAYSHNSEESIQSNYHGHEIRTAGYGMWTLHFGSDLTFLPGVRYQNLLTDYTAPRGKVTPIAGQIYQHTDTTAIESHGFWLPMVHLIYHPLSWLQVHLAYTNTLTYPDFSAITPALQIGDISPITISYHNFLLKPAHSTNYDAIVSIYNNSIGLLSVDGFMKHIKNLIFSESQYNLNPSEYPGLPNAQNYIGDIINTSFNNPYAVDLWGVELDWETHFWYLPGPLSGLVLSVNYTHIFSKAKYPYSYINVISQFPPVADTVNTYYSDRLIQQPDNIANLAVGYDYQGFSVRVSMEYDANVFEAPNFWPELRANTATYVRWDLAANQRLPWYGLQVYLDLNNLNSARNVQIEQGSGFPAAENHYGLTADFGVRLHI